MNQEAHLNTRILQNEEEILALTKQKESIEAEKKQIAEEKDTEI